MFRFVLCVLPLLAGSVLEVSALAKEPVPDYTRDVAPIFRKHCAGCHNADDREGGLSLESFQALQAGGEHGPAVAPGVSGASRLWQMTARKLKPVMPPDGLDPISEAELATLTAWIDGGAKGPSGAEPARKLITPKLPPADTQPAITALAVTETGHWLASGRFGAVTVQRHPQSDFPSVSPKDRAANFRILSDLPGKVNDLAFSPDGKLLLIGTGISGLSGTAVLYDVNAEKVLREFGGHRDILYAVAFSPDGKQLATAGYDRQIRLWDAETGKVLRTFDGHNGAVYDLAFDPRGDLLASASADETVKIWSLATGERLDTLGQPQGEQLRVVFSPDGKQIVAGGADNRLRVWRVVSRKAVRINPIRYARFAHEGTITEIVFSKDGTRLLSVADDQSAKLWRFRDMRPIRELRQRPDDFVTLTRFENTLVQAFAHGGIVGEPFPTGDVSPTGPGRTASARLVDATEQQSVTEAEPNDTPAAAQAIEVPATITGRIQAEGEGETSDHDLYRFSASQGEQWVIEVNAARKKSPLDSVVEVLTADGKKIERIRLQAVRDSYFTFRGKNSDTSDDFRVFNWEEMELNDLFYANGEVVKLWMYPRGPDSGFRVYPGRGKRQTYFDTTALSHPLHEPGYIVRPVPAGTDPIPNGLPVFPIYFVNDDDGSRRYGADSRLTFTAPADGDYLVKITDARGFSGEKFTYDLTVRPRKPDVQVRWNSTKLKVAANSGSEVTISVTRLDDYDGPVTVHLDGLPEGLTASTPITVEAGQTQALGTIYADDTFDADLTAEELKQIQITATAEIAGKSVERPVSGTITELKFEPKPPLRVRILPADGRDLEPGERLALDISPGETIRAVVEIDRIKFGGALSFGKDDSGRNLPHGVFVDNIGLNGLLITPDRSRREFFITASPIAKPGERLFHLRASGGGNPTSAPVLLRVK